MENTQCPRCGSDVIQHHDEDSWECSDCGLIFPKEGNMILRGEGNPEGIINDPCYGPYEDKDGEDDAWTEEEEDEWF